MSRRPARVTQADISRAIKAVAQSGYPHALYYEALQGWERRDRVALADGARKRTEVFWINPAAAERVNVPGAALHWRFRANRLRGEWSSPAPDLLTIINSVPK